MARATIRAARSTLLTSTAQIFLEPLRGGMKAPHTHLIYEFGDFELDAQRRVLTSRADGQQQQVTGRVFDTLLYLVERPGQLLDKRALMEALWPNVVVEEGNLTQTIHTLRKVLGERPGEHRYIVTIAGRGYRFVADVKVRSAPVEKPVPSESAPPVVDNERPRRRRIVTIALATSLAALLVIALFVVRGRDEPPAARPAQAMPSIAVLPFADMSAEQDQEYFADGLSEEILNLLAQSEAMRVIARTSSFSFKDQSVDLATIARRLDVTHVLEGSVRKSGDRLRITAQLIDGATSAHVWSETYDRNMQDIFSVQSEIAASVASALRVTLGSRAGSKRSETSSPEAHELYLQGRHLFNRRSRSDILRAKEYFEEALRIDPGYARAWAALAGVYIVAPSEGIQLPPDAKTKWREAIERGVALAPDLAETNVRAAQYYWRNGDRVAGRRYLAAATAANPSDPLLLGVLMGRAVDEGRIEDALSMQRRVTAMDPLTYVNRTNLGTLLAGVGRFEEAQVEFERALELSPASEELGIHIVQVLVMQRRTDEALTVIQHMPAGFARDQSLALTYHARGDSAEADAALARLIEVAERPDSNHEMAFAVAELYAMRAELDHAFQWLDVANRREKAAEFDTNWIANLRLSPLLESLRADPRWQALLAAVLER
jgi:TolB-like protein/DNA-binding winged helix-turn-helix (wHTH) protein/tetratricopeptide (TPR) repeat protein